MKLYVLYPITDNGQGRVRLAITEEGRNASIRSIKAKGNGVLINTYDCQLVRTQRMKP